MPKHTPESTPILPVHTQLEHTIFHSGISYDEEKGTLHLDESAIEAITIAIEEMKTQLLTLSPIAQPVENTSIPSNLVDAGIMSERIKVDKKGRVHGLLGNIFKLVKKNKPVPQDKLEKIVRKMSDSGPGAHIWVRVGERMLPVPLLIWKNSTFDSVRRGFEVRLRNAGILDRKIKVSDH